VLSVCSCTDAESISVVGGGETVQAWLAGVSSTLPAWSLARTWRV
jgi:hypothetical protein